MEDGRNAGRRSRQVRAHARPHRAPQSENLTRLVCRELDLLHVIASVGRRLIVLGARFDPFHWPPELHRAERGHEVTLDLGDLAAEPATNLRRHDAQAIFRHSSHDREDESGDVRVLGRVPQRQFTGRRCELSDRAARFHRGRDETLLDDAIADDHRRRVEGGFDVAARHSPVKRDVAGDLRMKLWRPGRRGLLGIDHRGQRLVVDVDELEGVVRLILGFGDHDGDGVADEPDKIRGQRAERCGLQIGIRDQPRAGNRFQHARRVGARVHGDDAGGLLRAARVDAAETRMAVRAPQDGCVCHPGQDEVCGVTRRSGQEPGILAPADAGSEHTGGSGRGCSRHRRPPVCAMRGSAAAVCTAFTMF